MINKVSYIWQRIQGKQHIILNTYTTAKRNFRKHFLLEQTKSTNSYSSESSCSALLEKSWYYYDLMRQNVLHFCYTDYLHWKIANQLSLISALSGLLPNVNSVDLFHSSCVLLITRFSLAPMYFLISPILGYFSL